MIPKHAFELCISSVENIDMLLSSQKICIYILLCLQNTKAAYPSTSETKFGNTRGGEIRSIRNHPNHITPQILDVLIESH